jgi:hypothetical protein
MGLFTVCGRLGRGERDIRKRRQPTPFAGGAWHVTVAMAGTGRGNLNPRHFRAPFVDYVKTPRLPAAETPSQLITGFGRGRPRTTPSSVITPPKR